MSKKRQFFDKIEKIRGVCLLTLLVFSTGISGQNLKVVHKAKTYWKTAVKMCKMTGTGLSLLLHPLDFLSGEDAPELKFFPAMSLPLEKKLEFLSGILETFQDSFSILNMGQHAENVAQTKLPVKSF